MKRKSGFAWRYIVVALIVLGGAVGIYIALQWRAAQPVYDYVRVDRGQMRVTLRESGDIQPEHRLALTPPIPGRVDTLLVENGASVMQGQVLAWLSSTDRAALIDAARAAGSKEFKFWQDVYKPAPLVAPLDGRIIATDVVPGAVVVTAQTVFVMADHLIAQANVDETDLDHIWKGQAVEITFEGFPDTTLTGKVHEIAYDSTTVNNVTTYLVNIFLDKTPPFVVSGLSTNLFFLVSDRPNILRIPTDALTTDGDVLVAQAKDKPPALRKVQIGATDGNYTEVVSGLQEGDWLAEQHFELKKASTNSFNFMGGPPRPPPRH